MVPEEQRKSMDELIFRVKVNSADGDKVRINLPMSLVKLGLEIGMDVSGTMCNSESLKNVDMQKLVELVEQGALGKLVEVESADGDNVEVVVE